METELYRLSPYNPEVGAHGVRTVVLNDCTLREGEQSSDAAFTEHDRREVAARLADAGVGRIQIAVRRGRTAENRSIVEAAAGAETEALILAFLPDWREQVDAALDAGVSHLNVIYRASPRLLGLLGRTADDLLETSVEALSYAREAGGRTVYSPGDTMRAEWSVLERVYPAAVDAGAEAVYVLDTVGVASPAGVARVVHDVVALVDVPVGVHVHNDLGLALPNALAAFESGASIIDTCVNGMGDRCGNPATDETAVTLALLYGAVTGVRLEALAELSDLVARRSGVPISPSKPFVGNNASTHKLDIHVRAMSDDPLAFQPFKPELVGATARIAVGKGSGPYTLATKLAELGLPKLSDNETAAVLAAVEEVAERTKRSVREDELVRLVATVRARKAGT